MIDFLVNGKAETGEAGMTIADLLIQLDLKHQRIAVEVNEDVLSKSVFTTTILQDGDKIEVVSFVGGG